jgi:TRAP-type C4-dicarboxylate transport system permease small subunit
MEGRMQIIEKWLNQVGVLFGAIAFVALPIFIIASIIARQFGFSLSFALEYSTYLIPVICLYAGGYVLSRGGHVNTDLFKNILGPRIWDWLTLLGLVLGLGYLVILGVECAQLSLDSIRFGYRSMYVTRTLIGYPQLVIPVGILLFAIQTVIEIIKKSKSMFLNSGEK